MATSICNFFKFGFCRYGLTCRRKHVVEVCSDASCMIENCEKRHPRVCKYYREYRRCKFGEFCCYKHILESESQILECQELENKIAALESIIESIRNEKAILASKVSNLEERLQDIETNAVCFGKDHVVGNLSKAFVPEVNSMKTSIMPSPRTLSYDQTSPIPQLDGEPSVIGSLISCSAQVTYDVEEPISVLPQQHPLSGPTVHCSLCKDHVETFSKRAEFLRHICVGHFGEEQMLNFPELLPNDIYQQAMNLSI